MYFKKVLFILSLAIFTIHNSFCEGNKPLSHNILYLNSYEITYSWADSMTSGVLSVIKPRKDLAIYVEYLDCNRFGAKIKSETFDYLKHKYKNTHFDAVIVSDNDALDFMIKFGDRLVPKVPVLFCGINNPEDYNFKNTRFWGIKEGVDQDSVIKLVIKIMPGIKNIYFLFDKATTSQINIKYIKRLESKYINLVKFRYIQNNIVDSIYKKAKNIEPGSAIALIDIFQDQNKGPLNGDIVAQHIAGIANAPVFIDSETLLGKGILGGIINIGTAQGREAAKLCVKFIDDPDFIPVKRVVSLKDKYCFDYNILKKFDINEKLLPPGAVIINKPHSKIFKYLAYIIVLLIIVGVLLTIIVFMVINTNRRKKAEKILSEKLLEIQQKNVKLAEANEEINDINNKLEEAIESIQESNEALMAAKEKSEESDKLKSAFLANMSHEIRTPMNAVMGFSSLLNNQELTVEERQKYSYIINRNCQHLLVLIEDILVLSKIESGSINIDIQSISVSELFDYLFDSFNLKCIENNIEFRIANRFNIGNIFASSDLVKLRQIFDNLISNAIKFTKQGFIEIGIFSELEDEITFYVKDTGTGISEKNMDKIFNRFWKVEVIGTSLNPGTGLGLAISKKLCELMNGRIWVQSEVGLGTTFLFTQPVSRAENIFAFNTPEPLTHNNTYSNFTLENTTIAIVEDIDTNLQYLAKIIKMYNGNYISFHNGIEIVNYFKNTSDIKIDLILMDIKMPEMDGYTAVSLLKQLNITIPVIAQTAYAMAEDIDKILKSGFDDFITKPILLDTLIKTLTKYIKD